MANRCKSTASSSLYKPEEVVANGRRTPLTITTFRVVRVVVVEKKERGARTAAAVRSVVVVLLRDDDDDDAAFAAAKEESKRQDMLILIVAIVWVGEKVGEKRYCIQWWKNFPRGLLVSSTRLVFGTGPVIGPARARLRTFFAQSDPVLLHYCTGLYIQ